jgi:predicted N-formylglutamate amidohydrolase
MSAEVVEVIEASVACPPLLLTCEHASNALPDEGQPSGWAWPDADRRLVDDHWAWDPGAATLTRALCERIGAPAVLSRFSRLLVDPNRPLDSETLFRDVADGLTVELNRHVTSADRERRLQRCYLPYHAAVDAMVQRHPGVPLLSMHTFTPVYEGQPRAVELGVLFDDDEAWALRWFEALRGHGYDVRLNEPWSGRLGLMYSVQGHARRWGRRCMELEVRQDHATDAVHVERVVGLLVAALDRVLAAD